MGTLATFLCKECGAAGCTYCLEPVQKQPGPCPVCHRPMEGCICRSHHQTVESDSTRKAAEAAVNQAMLHYYNRDAQGLARFIRELVR
jgi:hypothetical protein